MRLVMMGTGLFAEPTFEALLAGPDEVMGLVTQPDRDAGEKRGSTRQTGKGMKTIAGEHGLPVLQPESINSPEGVQALRQLRPDLLVVAAYGQILSREVLAVPPLGGINVHASLLPKYRGAAPIAWAIYHGETRTGVTIIRMTVGLDAGDMLAQEAVDIGPDETTGDVEARLAVLGARLATQVIQARHAGPVAGTKQDLSQVSKAPKMTKEHGALDWNRTGPQVCAHIRAMQPWPTAFTFWHRPGQEPLRLLVSSAWSRPLEEQETGSPGDLLVQPGKLEVVAGGRTAVDILELQPAGKKRMKAAEFLRGHPARPGDRLGPAAPEGP
jgi:methionyl-tRNA formyltransferase